MPAKRGRSAVVPSLQPVDEELVVAVGNLRIANDNVLIAEQQRERERIALFQIYENRLGILREIVANGARDGLTYGQVKYALHKHRKAHSFPRNLYLPKGDFDRIFDANQEHPSVARPPSPLLSTILHPDAM